MGAFFAFAFVFVFVMALCFLGPGRAKFFAPWI